MKRALFFLVPFTVLSAQALAAQTTATTSSQPILGKHDNNAPINISSDNFQADLNGKSGTYAANEGIWIQSIIANLKG